MYIDIIMSKNRIIEHNLNFYVIEQDIFEPDEIFYERMKYIISNLDKDKFDVLIKKSKIISNMKVYNCGYSSVVENLL